VRFLLDANLSPKLVPALVAAGHVARHVDEIGLLGASDMTIFDRAAADGNVLITADSDFSILLAAKGSAGPSVVLLRHVAELSWHEQRGASGREPACCSGRPPRRRSRVAESDEVGRPTPSDRGRSPTFISAGPAPRLTR